MSNLQLKNVQHDFEVPIGEIGVTVRLGDKWFQAFRSHIHDRDGFVVDLWQCPQGHSGECVATGPANSDGTGVVCKFRGTAKIIGAWRGKLIHVPDTLLALEHEKSSRNFMGLLFSMRRAYPNISSHDYVTALIYTRLTTNG